MLRNNRFPTKHFPAFVPSRSLDDVAAEVGSPTRTRIKIWIPKHYQAEPVISRLISEYSLTVNITGASLRANSQAEGLFDLELYGTAQQIQRALGYLQALEIEIKGKPNPDGDSWA